MEENILPDVYPYLYLRTSGAELFGNDYQPDLRVYVWERMICRMAMAKKTVYLLIKKIHRKLCGIRSEYLQKISRHQNCFIKQSDGFRGE
jgi:hypothetical protein